METASTPLKILQLVSGIDVNGALVHCHLLSDGLARRGHHVTVACRSGSWLWSQLDERPVRLVTCRMNRWPLSQLTRFADWIRRERFDVMHTHMSSAHMYGIIMKRLTGVPVVATAHSRHVQPWWRLNDLIIANSNATRQFHQRVNRVRQDKIVTIHPFIDTDKFCEPEPHMYRAIRRQWRFPAEARVIVVAGDVVPHKGHTWLFQALPELTKAFPDLRVVLVGRFRRGESCTDRLRQFLIDQQLFKRVKWIGRRNNMQEMLGAADLVVIPSTVEAFGMVALESMSVGTPVIATNTGGLTELITHHQNGILVPPRNPQSLVQAVSRLLRDTGLREQLRVGGQRMIRDRFAPPVLTAEIERVLESVANVYNGRQAA